MQKCIHTTTVRCMSSHGFALYHALSATVHVQHMCQGGCRPTYSSTVSLYLVQACKQPPTILCKLCETCTYRPRVTCFQSPSVSSISTQDQLSKTCCPAIAPACGSL